MKIDLGYTETKDPVHDFWYREGQNPFNYDDEDEDGDASDGETRTAYPSVYLADLGANAMDVPDKGTATVRFAVTERMYTETRDSDGKKKKTVCMTLELQSFSPEGTRDPLKESARDALERMAGP